VINILGNAALEGADKPATRFTNRSRRANYTQIFTAAVEVSGSDLVARQLALADEMEQQKLGRLRELMRDLENTVINGGQPASDPQGSDTARRTMKGIVQHLATNIFRTGDSGFPRATSSTRPRSTTPCARSGEQQRPRRSDRRRRLPEAQDQRLLLRQPPLRADGHHVPRPHQRV